MNAKSVTLGSAIVSDVRNALNLRPPPEPILRSHSNFRPCHECYTELKEHFGTNDHPIYIEAMFTAVLRSDHPMLRDELKKLYVKAKLSIPSDDQYVEEASNHISRIIQQNRMVDEENEIVTNRFHKELKTYKQTQIETRKKFDEWWDLYVAQVEKLLSDLPPMGDRSAWQQITLTAFDTVSQHHFYKPLKAGWYKGRRFSMGDFLSSEWRGAGMYGALPDFANRILQALNTGHKNWIEDRFKELFNLNTKTDTFRSVRRQIKDEITWQKRRGHHRYMDEQALWYYKTGRDHFGNYNSPYGTQAYKDARELLEEQLRVLEDKWQKYLYKIADLCEEEIAQRVSDGLDGYDKLYKLPNVVGFISPDGQPEWNFEYDLA